MIPATLRGDDLLMSDDDAATVIRPEPVSVPHPIPVAGSRPSPVAIPAPVPIRTGPTRVLPLRAQLPELKISEVLLTPFSNLGGRLGSPGPPPLGPLQNFQGTWVGNGFNLIWRPNFAGAPGAVDGTDHFLMLNLTSENLVFTAVSTTVPNRGLTEPDISLAAVQYVQQIADANFPPPAGGGAMPFEPGLWLVVAGRRG